MPFVSLGFILIIGAGIVGVCAILVLSLILPHRSKKDRNQVIFYIASACLVAITMIWINLPD
jgi:hypothetical protein